MPQRIDHLNESAIRHGYAVFEQRLEVAGIHHRKKNARRFLGGARLRLALEPEPKNRADTNAIKVIGVWKAPFGQRSAHIGYVPAEIAAAVAACGLTGSVGARLADTYVGDKGFIVVAFQLIGPADRRKNYAAQTGDAPIGDTWNDKAQREAEGRLIDIYRSLTKKGREYLLALAETIAQSHRASQ